MCESESIFRRAYKQPAKSTQTQTRCSLLFVTVASISPALPQTLWSLTSRSQTTIYPHFHIFLSLFLFFSFSLFFPSPTLSFFVDQMFFKTYQLHLVVNTDPMAKQSQQQQQIRNLIPLPVHLYLLTKSTGHVASVEFLSGTSVCFLQH